MIIEPTHPPLWNMLMLHLGPYPHVYKHRCINIHIHIHPNPYQNDNNKSITYLWKVLMSHLVLTTLMNQTLATRPMPANSDRRTPWFSDMDDKRSWFKIWITNGLRYVSFCIVNYNCGKEKHSSLVYKVVLIHNNQKLRRTSVLDGELKSPVFVQTVPNRLLRV